MRLTQYIEQSLPAGLQWTVFAPNDSALWGAVLAVADGFMQDLWRQGQGESFKEIKE